VAFGVDEIVARANALIGELRALGLAQHASAIDDAVFATATGGELRAALGYALGALLEHAGLAASLRTQAEQLRAGLV
jgi:hypothetical protein